MQATQLPTLKELYDNDGLEITTKQNALNLILNQNPKQEWLKEHPLIKVKNTEGKTVPLKFVPIERVEWLLTNIFVEWRVEVLSSAMIANSVTVTIRLHVKNPVTGEWTYQDGVGASPLQTDSGAGAIDWNKIKSTAVQMALPAAKSYAVSDAADCFGRIFGKDLNRQATSEYGVLKGKFSTEWKNDNELRLKLEDITTKKELDEFVQQVRHLHSDQEVMDLFNERAKELVQK